MLVTTVYVKQNKLLLEKTKMKTGILATLNLASHYLIRDIKRKPLKDEIVVNTGDIHIYENNELIENGYISINTLFKPVMRLSTAMQYNRTLSESLLHWNDDLLQELIAPSYKKQFTTVMFKDISITVELTDKIPDLIREIRKNTETAEITVVDHVEEKDFKLGINIHKRELEDIDNIYQIIQNKLKEE